MTGRSALALAVVMTLSNACTADPDGVATPDPGLHESDAVATLDCATPITGVAALPDTYEVIGGAVALPTATSSSAALQTTQADGKLRLFAKAGLLLRAGEEFTLAASDEWKDRATAWWGNTGRIELADAFAGGPCDGAEWLAYPGGLFVADPGCVPFEVLAADGVHDVQIGVGAPCPGQALPPEPTAT